MTLTLKPEPLTRSAFARFGNVIEMAGAYRHQINQGYAERFNDFGRIDTAIEGGETNISLCRAAPRPPPITLTLMERHPLGSQAFYPLQARDWLIVVADPRMALNGRALRAFRATGQQGVNYARNVWHHPLLVLEPDSDFLIVDRKGPGNNLEEVSLAERVVLDL